MSTTDASPSADSFAVTATRSTALEGQIAADSSRFRVLTGDRPTGALHLGHYFGTASPTPPSAACATTRGVGL